MSPVFSGGPAFLGPGANGRRASCRANLCPRTIVTSYVDGTLYSDRAERNQVSNHMAKKRKAKKAKTKRKRKAIPQALTPNDIFEGIKGRRPKSDEELNEWLASPEGKAAMRSEQYLDRWGETI